MEIKKYFSSSSDDHNFPSFTSSFQEYAMNILTFYIYIYTYTYIYIYIFIT